MELKIYKPDDYRLWQAIYNAIALDNKAYQMKMEAQTPIEYDREIVDRKAILADALFNISDKKLMNLLDEHLRQNTEHRSNWDTK